MPFDQRADAARRWAAVTFLAGDTLDDEAVGAFEPAVELLPRTAGRHLVARDRERQLKHVS